MRGVILATTLVSALGLAAMASCSSSTSQPGGASSSSSSGGGSSGSGSSSGASSSSSGGGSGGGSSGSSSGSGGGSGSSSGGSSCTVGQPCLVTLASQENTESGGNQCRAIAVNASNVYFVAATGVVGVDTGNLQGVPLTGGTPTNLGALADLNALLAVNASNAYWVEASGPSGIGAIVTIPLDGGTVTGLDPSPPTPTPYYRALALDSSNIYWADVGSGAVGKISLAGGTPTTLSPGTAGEQEHGIAVDSTDVYWTGGAGPTSGSVYKVPLGGGSATTLAPSQGTGPAFQVGITSSAVFWNTLSAVYSVPKGGGSVSTLASGLTLPAIGITPGTLSVDETNVYFIEALGTAGTASSTIVSIPVTGGTPTTLAVRSGLVGGLVNDATSLYWIESVTKLNDAGTISSTTCNVMSLTPK